MSERAPTPAVPAIGAHDPPPFADVDVVLDEVRAGRQVIVCDEEEGDGVLTAAAGLASSMAINFMAMQGRGLICLALTPERCDELRLPLMAARNGAAAEMAFTVSVNAREGVAGGISARDRAHTIRVAVDPKSSARDLVRPGHVFPLKAKAGGVLERTGYTEAAVDLARLAGLQPAGVICQILDEDGAVARLPSLWELALRHELKVVTIASLIAYRHRNERLIEQLVTTTLPTAFGEFTAAAYRSLVDGEIHLALVKGEVAGADEVLVRVHSECLTGDAFHSMRCDCGQQLEMALQAIEQEGRGVLLYLAQEGRGIGLLNKLRAYRLQESGFDTVDANLELGLGADLRDYWIGAQILADLRLGSIRLLTNNPKKVHGLRGYGLDVVAQIPIEPTRNEHNESYLRAKAERMGHVFGHRSASPERPERTQRSGGKVA